MTATILQAADKDAIRPRDIVKLLSNRNTYPHRPGRVDVLETHISCVFLTDRFVYKLKKPVRYEFLDFTSVERRKRACEDEVRLNRRLAPGVYLRVLPVTVDDDRLALAGRGRAVDWVVEMRRLPDERMLDELLRAGRLTDADVARLAAMLAHFYQQAPPLILRPAQYRDAIESHVLANYAELLSARHRFPATLVKRVQAAQLRLLRCAPELLDSRVRDGRIIDGHGDLRPEHVCLVSPPVVFDCIEFSAELRQIDVVDELSFLAMECDGLEAPDVGRTVLEAYCRAAGDVPPEPLVNFYKCYRACVRAKVAALRSRQLSGAAATDARQEALRYLHLADRYVAGLGAPELIVVRGLSGAGKSTLAGELCTALGAECLSTDAIRHELWGQGDRPAAYGRGIYSDDRRRQVYQDMFRRAAGLLHEGLSVVLDGTFLTTAARDEALTLAGTCGALPLMVHCRCPADVARQRVASRELAGQDLSEARPDLLAAQRSDEEADPPHTTFVEVDTTQSLPVQVSLVFRGLHRLGPFRRRRVGSG